ncbi:hypothetical protein Mapa_016264 [Marchantia paleacea]|nr:hypothetical protein Mapa_016264 [Marchantia paleacea]
MMSVSDFFYGAREPVWIVHTPQSSSKSYIAGTPQTPQSVHTRGGHTEIIHHSTVELKVPVCCEACEERVKHALLNCNGVDSVRCDTIRQRVTVTGTAAPADLLKICKKLHKRSELLGGNTGTGKKGKNTPGSVTSVGVWARNTDWKNTPSAISAWL